MLGLLVNSFESCTSGHAASRPTAGTTIALFSFNLQDWLPGVAGIEPRLGSGFLGGQFEKGGLHQPPFSFPRVLSGGWPVRAFSFPRVCHRNGSSTRALLHLGPFGFYRPDLAASWRFVKLPLPFASIMHASPAAHPTRLSAPRTASESAGYAALAHPSFLLQLFNFELSTQKPSSAEAQPKK